MLLRKIVTSCLHGYNRCGALKTCKRCNSSTNGFHKDASKLDGLCTLCKLCRNAAARREHHAHKDSRNAWQREYARTHRSGYTARQKKWRQENPLQHKNQVLRTTYGISLEGYADLLAKQNGVCAICAQSPLDGEYLCVDHDHKTAVVRGLLCRGCNMGLGFLQDNPTLCFKAISYLLAGAA